MSRNGRKKPAADRKRYKIVPLSQRAEIFLDKAGSLEIVVVDDYKGVNGEYLTGTALKPEIAALMDDVEALEKIRTLVMEGLKAAGENRRAAMANGDTNAGAEKNTAGAVFSKQDPQYDFTKPFAEQVADLKRQIQDPNHHICFLHQ